MILLLAVAIVVAAIVASARGVDVRLALFAAALALGALGGDLPAIARAFFDTFSSEKFVVPICSAMGFAYVLKRTGCDTHLVRLLMAPVRRIRILLVPGVVVVGFVVNIPLISQTSTAVCLGTVVIPLMRAAGYSMRTIGSTLILGASIGGELLNPGAPELLTVKHHTGTDTQILTQQYLPQLVLPLLGVAAVAFWLQTLWLERRFLRSRERERPVPTLVGVHQPPADNCEGPVAHARGSEKQLTEPINVLRALVPLVPLVLLVLAGPPFDVVRVPDDWVALKPDLVRSRQIGLAMLVGVGAAALAAPRAAKDCMRSFFEGAGYGFANIVSIIVIATCFGEGIRAVGLADALGAIIRDNPDFLQPLAAGVPWAFAWVSGSGMASTQCLFGFFVEPAANLKADANAVGALVAVSAAVGRTMSPVAAVTLMTAALVGESPLALAKRIAGPALFGLAVVVALRMLGWV